MPGLGHGGTHLTSDVEGALDFEAVRVAVAAHTRVTPLLPAVDLSERCGRDVLVKAECLQLTGSFKVRGAAARLSALGAAERKRGVIACSSGNHGRAVAFVAERLGVPSTVFVPEWVDPVKLDGIRACGAEAVPAGTTFDESETLAKAAAAESGRTYVSAYDDEWVIAGQGTLAEEIIDQLGTPPAAVVVPLSGGGLAGGIAQSLAHRLGGEAPPCVAISASNAAVMLESVRRGCPVELPEQDTLASALSGGIGLDNRYSFALVRDLIDQHAVVDEDAIAAAMRYCVERLRLVVEGGGSVAVAALLCGAWHPDDVGDGPIVVVLSGGNVQTETLMRVLGR